MVPLSIPTNPPSSTPLHDPYLPSTPPLVIQIKLVREGKEGGGVSLYTTRLHTLQHHHPFSLPHL